MKTEWYLKSVTSDMQPPMAFARFKFVVGKWTPKRKPELCRSGWHVSDMRHISEFDGYSRRLFVCVARGKFEKGYQKSAHEQIMLVFEVNQNDFVTYFKRDRLAQIKAEGILTPKALKLAKTSYRIRSFVDDMYGSDQPKRTASALRDDAKFRAYFKRYVERKLRAMGYE